MVDLELDELKREFLAEAEEKVREMETAIGTAADRKSLDRLAYLAHQLKGSGGSYGYQAISSESAEIERAVEQFPGDGNLEGKIREHVGRLAGEIDRSLKELSAR